MVKKRKKKYSIFILDGYPVELITKKEIKFYYSFFHFYEEISKYFSYVNIATPHIDKIHNNKFNVVYYKKNITFYLLPFFSDPIHFFKKFFFNLYPNLKGLWLAIKNSDISFLRFPSPLLPFAYFFSVINKKKIILFVMGSWIENSKFLEPSITNYLKKVILIIFEMFHKFLVKRYFTITTYPYLKENISNVKFGFILPIKELEIKKLENIKRDFSNIKNKINILFVGRLTEAKGVFILLQAFKKLNSVYKKEKTLTLHIVGDGYLKENIKKYIKRNNLNNVVLYGHISWENLKKIYLKTDIFVLPSFTEGVPKVVFEAMLFRIPVIATKVGALPYLFKDKVHCIFTEVGNINHLYKTLKYMIENSQKAKIIARNAYNICKKYNLETTTFYIVRLIYENL